MKIYSNTDVRHNFTVVWVYVYNTEASYRKSVELGKVGLVKLHSLCPWRIGRRLKLQLQIVEGAVSLPIRELG